MSKEERVYVENNTSRDIVVEVSRDDDGDIKVELSTGAEVTVVPSENGRSFDVPAGDE